LARGTRSISRANGTQRRAYGVERKGEAIEHEGAEPLCERWRYRRRRSRHIGMLPLDSLLAEGRAEALAEEGELGVDREPLQRLG
jgi:hypothetical protein